MALVKLEKRKALLKEFQTLTLVAQDMLIDNIPLRTSCHNHGVSVKKLEKYIARDLMSNDYQLITKQNIIDDYYSWEDIFIKDLLREEEAAALPDFHECFDIALGKLNEKEADVIRKFYKDNMTLEDIGKIYGVTKERIRQLVTHGLRRLRSPACIWYFREGLLGREIHDEEIRLDRFRRERAALLVELRKKNAIVKKQIKWLREKGVTVESLPSETIKFSNNSIDTLDLSVRSAHCLRRAGCNTVADVMNLTTYELKHIRNLGKKSYAEIEEKLLAIYKFRHEEENYCGENHL